MVASIPSFNFRRSARSGFTLIELLIVIAIILILIAIALPNFLEAQMRARVTRAKAEMRSLHIALDSYYLDWRVYPPEHERDDLSNRGLTWLTTPNPYIKFLPEDPFQALGPDHASGFTNISYETGGIEQGGSILTGTCATCLVTWVLFSNGPDVRQTIWADNPHYDADNQVFNYSPTNGTTSTGDICRWGGDPFWIGIQISRAVKSAVAMAPKPGRTVDGQIYFHRLPPF